MAASSAQGSPVDLKSAGASPVRRVSNFRPESVASGKTVEEFQAPERLVARETNPHDLIKRQLLPPGLLLSGAVGAET